MHCIRTITTMYLLSNFEVIDLCYVLYFFKIFESNNTYVFFLLQLSSLSPAQRPGTRRTRCVKDGARPWCRGGRIASRGLPRFWRMARPPGCTGGGPLLPLSHQVTPGAGQKVPLTWSNVIFSKEWTKGPI